MVIVVYYSMIVIVNGNEMNSDYRLTQIYINANINLKLLAICYKISIT